MVQLQSSEDFKKKYDIKTRPNAGPGFWLIVLLPLSLIISNAKHSILATQTYKLASIFSLGLLSSSVILLKATTLKNSKFWMFSTVASTALLFQICLHRGWLFCLWSAVMSTIFYQKAYEFVLKKLPNCFTLGEAAICTQSFVLLLYFTLLNIAESLEKNPTGIMQISTLIIQLGLMGLSIIIYCCYKFSIHNPVGFYSIVVFIVLVFILLPLHILLDSSPVIWIVNLIIDDFYTSRVVLYWCFCSTVAVLVVSWKIKKATKASTSTRKIFHILAISVFIPGLLYNCSFLYLSSGIVLGIFFALELLRILHMPPLGQQLQDGLFVWSDEKDAGIIALTPIYLLAGCSLPLWIHPAPCDVTNSALFNLLPLLSGVLTVGIGDTAASIVGSKFGAHKWKDSRKSVEGTIAMILSQGAMLYMLQYFGFLKLTQAESVKSAVSVVITSIIEAKTDQVDNLSLPFVMYLILI